MKKRKLLCACIAMSIFGFIGLNLTANAGYLDVLYNIGTTAHTINAVNSATRGTLSTVEYGQRFQDRQQDRYDRKRSEKEYNENAQEEYYKTLQETQALKQEYYRKNDL